MSAPPLKTGYVLKVLSQYKVLISLGRKDGVFRGMRFVIYEEGDMVNDPKSGKPIERLELVKGTVEITHVQERMSIAESSFVERRVYMPLPYPQPQVIKEKERLTIQAIPEPKLEVKVGDLVKQLI
jgi:hypothetical protein